MSTIETRTSTSFPPNIATATAALYRPTPAAMTGEQPVVEVFVIEVHDGEPVMPLHPIEAAGDTGISWADLDEDPYLDPEPVDLCLNRRGWKIDGSWHVLPSEGECRAWVPVHHEPAKH